MGAMSTLRNMWYDDEDGWTYYEQSSKAKIDVDVFLSNATPNVPGTVRAAGGGLGRRPARHGSGREDTSSGRRRRMRIARCTQRLPALTRYSPACPRSLATRLRARRAPQAHGRGKVRETRLQANYGQTKFIKP